MLSDQLTERLQVLDNLVSQRMSQHLKTGAHKSRTFGSGIEFARHREYEPGDNQFHIDQWSAANANEGDELLVRDFIQERELKTVIMADASRSIVFGSNSEKTNFLLEIIGLFGLAANYCGDNVGLVAYGSSLSKSFSPRGGKNYIYFLLEEIWEKLEKHNQRDKVRADLNEVFQTLDTEYRQTCFVPIISDFLNIGNVDWDLVKTVAMKHDVIAIQISVRQELEFKSRFGYIKVQDIETGATVRIRQRDMRKLINILAEKRQELAKKFEDCGVGYLELTFDQEGTYVDKLIEKFVVRRAS